MLTKLHSQTDQVTALESGLPLRPSINLPSMWTDGDGFDKNYTRQGRSPARWDWGHHESTAWRTMEADTILFIMQW